MSALPDEPKFSVPAFIYTTRKACATKQEYSIQDIESAIHTLISGNLEILSESTLEAILDIVYYPDNLGLLLNESITPSLFGILMQYTDGLSVQQAISFSFGCLLFQCLALATSIGVLAQNDRLEPFVKSIGPSAGQNRTDVSPLMTTWLMEMINEDIFPPHVMLTNIKERLGWTIIETKPFCAITTGGHNFMSTVYMILHCIKGRDGVLRAYTSRPTLGWPVLFLVMWAQVKSSTIDEKQTFMTKLRETVFRYSLVSAPNERFVMQALVDGFADCVPAWEKHPPTLNSFNTMGLDAIDISTALMEKLSFHQTDSSSEKLKYLTSVTEYALQVLDNAGFSNLFSILEAAFERLWHELGCDSESLDKDFLAHVILFATLLLQATVRGFARLSVLNEYEIDITLVPEINLVLANIDIASLLGRLILLPSAAMSPKTSSTVPLAILNENLQIISQLAQYFFKYPQLTWPVFHKGYLDWLKTFNYMVQIGLTSIRQDHPLWDNHSDTLIKYDVLPAGSLVVLEEWRFRADLWLAVYVQEGFTAVLGVSRRLEWTCLGSHKLEAFRLRFAGGNL
ncbi:hypothetical protein BDV93DRAFT_577474 [Ceratobasidium sp. AG-I]|nr:hypothetical protein BDV93DRAFT_577474 [Ceratobasidium sp. AG-I]